MLAYCGANLFEKRVGRDIVGLNRIVARASLAAVAVASLCVGAWGQGKTPSPPLLVLTKDGRTIFVSNVESNTVSVEEMKKKITDWTGTNVKVGKGPEGIDISPDEKEVWAANSGDGTVSIIDVASKKVTQTVDVKTKHSNRLKFTPDGKLVLISDLG